MNKKTAGAGGGFTFVMLLQLAFIILKLCNVITWSWVLVLMPLIVSAVLAFVALVCLVIIIILGDADWKEGRKMTSKEAINELIEGAKFDLNKWELDRLGIIDQDLYTLEILRKYVRYDDENHVILMKPFRKSVFNFDYEYVKEWIEKWWREK